MNLSNLFKLGDIIQSSNSKYKILKKLGNGGNGTAYLALCINGCNRGVYFVIKFFYKIDKKDRLERFNREKEFLKGCNHPSIIKIYEDGVHKVNEEEYPYYVMEYMTKTLQQEIDRGRLPLEKAFMYTTQLLSALEYMQSQNIIHRDIKPENIFIKGNSVILGDFGLLKKIDTNFNSTKEEVESDKEYLHENISQGNEMPFNYRTPQLVAYLNENIPLSLNTDIFQMGITITIMFTGENPVKKCKNKSDKFEYAKPLNDIFRELRNLKQGIYIINILKGMIAKDEKDMLDISKLLLNTEKTFFSYLKDKIKLDGNILS